MNMTRLFRQLSHLQPIVIGFAFTLLSLAPPVSSQSHDGSVAADTAFVLKLAATSAPRDNASRITDLATYDTELQKQLMALVNHQSLVNICRQERLGIAVVDLSDLDHPRYAGVNDQLMMYAASLPKIAILLTAFELMEKGRLAKSRQNLDMLTAMIRHSSNGDASRAIAKVGFANIQRTVMDPRYRLYEPGIGGLWVGKPYSKAGVWKREPVKNVVHGATARAAARFYYMLERGELVSPRASAEMKEILSAPALHHKFVKGLECEPGRLTMYRKSGTWRIYHSDSALINHNGHTYIAVALAESTRGEAILRSLIVGIDGLIERLHKASTKHGNGK